MTYLLSDIGEENRKKVLKDLGQKEASRLERYGYFDEPSSVRWALDEQSGSYLFKTLTKGDPKESAGLYCFFFGGQMYFIKAIGSLHIEIDLSKTEKEISNLNEFKNMLMEAMLTYGPYGHGALSRRLTVSFKGDEHDN